MIKQLNSIRKAYSLNENDVLSLNNAACYYVMVDKDIWRGYSNIESAYNDMPSDLDEELKDLITNNYKQLKKYMISMLMTKIQLLILII